MTTSIVYYTDGNIEDSLGALVRRYLVKAADGKEIISVSQKPIPEWPNTIVIEPMERSHLSMYREMLIGGEATTGDTIALAEHDCLYTSEHFNWQPPDRETFWYNVNHWFAQHGGRRHGQFSYQRRKVLSMLIVDREQFIKAAKEKVWLIENGWMIKKGIAGACEPGVTPPEEGMIKANPADEPYVRSLPIEPGVVDHRGEILEAMKMFKDLGKEVGRWKAQAFRTNLPNLDIRHGQNFSGRRMGKDVRTSLEPWGSWDDVLRG